MSPPAMILAQLIGADRSPAAEIPTAAVSQALASFWSEVGVAAHAAITAQAELAAHLLRVGAPVPLLHGAARSLLDETAISEACLELARRHGAPEVSLPLAQRRESALDLGGEVLGTLPLDTLLLNTLRRGCIAATVESCCAREALEHCDDPAAREVLLQLQHGRARAAQLSWRFLGWALRGAFSGDAPPASGAAPRARVGGAELADQVRVAVLTALVHNGSGPEGTRAAPATLSPGERQLLRHGVLGQGQRLALEQRVLREVVLPCMENALARARSGSAHASGEQPSRSD